MTHNFLSEVDFCSASEEGNFLAVVEIDNLFQPSHQVCYALPTGTQMSSDLRTQFSQRHV
jgi:hypothetical protein